MRTKFVYLLTVAFFQIHINSNGQGAWVRRANFPTIRELGVGFNIGAKGYIGTGRNFNDATNDFWEYDPVNNTWTQKADVPGGGRVQAVGFSINSKGYIGTGVGNGIFESDFWEYDPISNTWTQKADVPGGPRREAVGFSIGPKGYIGTGSGDGLKNDFWEYDPSFDLWIQKANVPGGVRADAVGFGISDKGYIGIGGNGNQGGFQPPAPVLKNDFWEYDPFSNTWTQKANFIGFREYAVGFSMASKGYVGTGYIGDSWGNPIPTNDFWEYNPLNDSWSQKTSISTYGRYMAVGFSVGDRGYIGTGRSFFNDFWEFRNCNTSSHTVIAACDQYLWNGVLYTTSGDKTYTTTNAAGCDSVATLHLTIKHSSTSSTTVSACDEYLWNGVVYTTSGDKTYTTTNAAGCDSVATLHLTIKHSSTSSTTVSACDQYLWNGVVYTTSGDKTFTTTNAAGCDSVATLHLTIKHSSTSSTTVSACDQYLWNGVVYTTSGDK
ncbi:MAG TPA: kelch repeat-containing protein, partial [Chitinophagaceae bacterium]|nr:kelch repeat-containing protein [Chitinophagaceae bacterium]